MTAPVLKKVAGGWLAISDVPGDEWAVIAPTEEDALRYFYAQREKRREIAARPFNFERNGWSDDTDDLARAS
jgi:hypothetical protein